MAVPSLANTEVAKFFTNSEWLSAVVDALDAINAPFTGMLVGSATWDAASIADGDAEDKDIVVTGAALGDFVTAVSFSLDLTGLQLTAAVTATDTVTATLSNSTGGAVDLASGTVRVVVVPQASLAAAPTVRSTLLTK